MGDPYNLQRFVDAQESVIATALSELTAGSKKSHWMWFIFPQLAGLGHSPAAQFYALSSIAETRAYLDHALLGPRYRKCLELMLPWSGSRSAEQILGPIDALKLRSSLTLFDLAEPSPLFKRCLEAFFDGHQDKRTLALLNATL